MAQIGKDKYIFGTVKVGERGQVVIPLEARKVFGIKAGDLLLVAGDVRKGLALSKIEGMKKYAMHLLGALANEDEEEGEEEATEPTEDANGGDES